MKSESVIHVRSRLRVFKGCPNLIPFLSVFFILLVFFIKRAEFVKGKGVQVDLPQTLTQEQYYSKKLYVIADNNGTAYFNDMAYRLDGGSDKLKGDLAKALKEFTNMVSVEKSLENTSDLSIVVAADRNIPFETVAKLMAVQKDLDMGIFFLTNDIPSSVSNFRDSE